MAKKRTKIGFDPLAWMKAGTGDVPTAAPVPAAPAVKAQAAPEAVAPPKKAAPVVNAPAELRLDAGETLDLAHAARLHAEFKQALAQKKPLRLNLSRVQLADTAGVQLLLALRREGEKDGVAVVWGAPTGAVVTVASQLGLGEALGLPSAVG